MCALRRLPAASRNPGRKVQCHAFILTPAWRPRFEVNGACAPFGILPSRNRRERSQCSIRPNKIGAEDVRPGSPGKIKTAGATPLRQKSRKLSAFYYRAAIKARSLLARSGARSCRSALASICRIRSRVTSNSWPISSSVCSRSHPIPNRSRITFSSLVEKGSKV